MELDDQLTGESHAGGLNGEDIWSRGHFAKQMKAALSRLKFAICFALQMDPFLLVHTVFAVGRQREREREREVPISVTRKTNSAVWAEISFCLSSLLRPFSRALRAFKAKLNLGRQLRKHSPSPGLSNCTNKAGSTQ